MKGTAHMIKILEALKNKGFEYAIIKKESNNYLFQGYSKEYVKLHMISLQRNNYVIFRLKDMYKYKYHEMI